MNPDLSDDDVLLGVLAETLDLSEPLPEHVAAAAIDGAFALGPTGTLLADIVSDSRVAPVGAPVRDGADGPDVIVFSRGDLGLEVEIDWATSELIGQVLPPGPADVVVQLRTTEHVVAADELGRFAIALADDFFRLRIDRSDAALVTPWVRL